LTSLVRHREASLSGAICVLVAWDEPRRDLVARLRGHGVPTLVLVMAETGSVGAEADVHWLEVGRVAEGLAGL
jgi:hypothetical protein